MADFNYGINTAPGSTFAGANALGGGTTSGGFLAQLQKNPQLLSFALDALGGIINPSQRGFTPGSDLARSKIAAGAQKRRQGDRGFTPVDQDGDTSVTRKAGPGGKIIETTTRTLPSGDQDPLSPAQALADFRP